MPDDFVAQMLTLMQSDWLPDEVKMQIMQQLQGGGGGGGGAPFSPTGPPGAQSQLISMMNGMRPTDMDRQAASNMQGAPMQQPMPQMPQRAGGFDVNLQRPMPAGLSGSMGGGGVPTARFPDLPRR